MNINMVKEAAAASFPSHALALLQGMEEDLTDAMYLALAPVIGASSVDGFVQAYTDDNPFLSVLAHRVRDGRELSVAQKRATLNIIRRTLRGETGVATTPEGPIPMEHVAGSTPTHRTRADEREYECFTCHVKIKGRDALYEHRRKEHGTRAAYKPPVPEAERSYDCFKCGETIIGLIPLRDHKRRCTGKKAPLPAAFPSPDGTRHPAPAVAYDPPYAERTVPVLPVFTPRFSIDLRDIADGRYAIQSADGKARFFWKSTVKRDATLRGRFVWGKSRWGNERAPKGTILVRELIGDTKGLVGIQRLDEGMYHGEYEDEIKYIHEHANEALVLYGILSHDCGYCGRSLTDEVSRARGIGPDCWEAKHLPRLHSTEDAEARAAYAIRKELGLV